MLELIKSLVYVEVLTCVGLLLAKFCLKKNEWQEFGAPVSTAAVLLPAAAYLLPMLVMLHVVMLSIVPMLCWRKPHLIAPVYVFSMMLLPSLEKSLLLGGVPLWPHDIHTTLGIGALISLLAFQPRRAAPSFTDGPFVLLFLLMLFMAARDTSATNVVREGISAWIHYAIPYYVLSRNVRGPEDVRRFMLALCTAGIFLSFVAMFEIARAWPIFQILYDKFDTNAGAYVKVRAGLIRSAGPFVESTSFGFVLVFCFVATVLLRDQARSFWKYGLLCGVAFIGLLPPQSRGAWIGAIFALVLAQIYLGNLKKLFATGFVITCFALFMFPLIRLNGRAAEFVGLSGHAIETARYRERLFERGMEQVSLRPFTGTNRIQLLKDLQDLTQGEGIVDFVNHLLYVALIAGIPGLLIFVGAFAAAALQVWFRRGVRPTKAFAFVFVGAVLPIVMLGFTSLGGRPAVLVIMFVGLAAAVSRSKIHRQAPVTAELPAGRLAG